LPDGQGIVVEVFTTPHNLWRLDFRSGAMTPLTHDGANHRAVLGPDGRFMAFSSDRVTPRSLFRQATDGSGTAERLLDAPHPHNATSWSRDGRWLAFTEEHPQRQEDIWILALEGDRAAHSFLATPYDEGAAVFSPDAHWIAYTSDETGRDEVYVRDFPGAGHKWQVSNRGGLMPHWRRDGRELFYLTPDGTLMAVGVNAGGTFEVGDPQVLFATGLRLMPRYKAWMNQYAVSRDAQRFLLNRPVPETSNAITAVVPWLPILGKPLNPKRTRTYVTTF